MTRIKNPGDSVFRLLDLDEGGYWESRKGRHTFSTEKALRGAMRYGWCIPENYRIVEFKLTEVKT